jgi:hypothetical protein
VIEQDTLQVTLADGTALAASSCQLRVDEGATPYTSATLTIKMPSLAVLAQLDPNARPVVRVRASRRQGSTGQQVRSSIDTSPRLVDRSVDLRSGTVSLTLANDETSLEYAPAVDVDLLSLNTSVRAIAQEVVRRATGRSATTVTAAVDRAFVPSTTQKNLMPEGGFERGINRWKPVNARLDISPSYSTDGANTLRIQPNSASFDSFAEIDAGLVAGKTYRIQGYLSSDYTSYNFAPDGRTQQIVVVAAMNGYPEVIAKSSALLMSLPDVPRLRMVEFTMPPNITASSVRLYNGANNAATPANGGMYWDSIAIFEAPLDLTDSFTRHGYQKVLPYFDGDTVDTDRFIYTWDGERGSSTSTRRPRVARNPESLVWRRGQTARDFLTPVLQAVGLRIYQDVTGTWRLTDNSDRPTARTRLDVRSNIYQIVDAGAFNSTYPDGSPVWADAVAVTYRWTDDEGNDREAVDVDAPDGYTKLYQLTLQETPYPGPGQAAYLRGRFAQRARQMTVTARPDYGVLPSQELTIVTDHVGLLTGYVDSVAFDHAADEMTVVGKNLVSTPATAWNQLGIGVRWSDSPVGASWASETA